VNSLVDELVALERSALDRWIELDPQGYLDAEVYRRLNGEGKLIHSHWSFIQPEVKQPG
jgi:hypothetical protein